MRRRLRNLKILLRLPLGWSGLQLYQSLGGNNLKDISSYNSSYTLKDETKSDLEAEYEQALDDLIKVKKCSIMLLKRLNKSKVKVLQLQECETRMNELKEKNKAFLERLSKVECDMEDTHPKCNVTRILNLLWKHMMVCLVK